MTDEEKQPQTPLDRLGLDSLERMDIALAIEDRFGFRSDRVADTLGELWALAEGHLSGSGGAPLVVPPAWNEPPGATGPTEIHGDTLGEAFVRRALQWPNDVAVADQVSGVLTYRKLLVAARLMAKRLGKLPGDAVGVLLPASVAADLVFFSLHLAQQAAGHAQLDHGTGQPGPCGGEAGHPPRGYFAEVDRSAGH